MPGYRFWEFEDPEDQRKRQASDFLAQAQQASQQADYGKLQQHVGGILENFQNDIQSRMAPYMPQQQPAAPAPVDDPVPAPPDAATAPPAAPAMPDLISKALDYGKSFIPGKTPDPEPNPPPAPAAPLATPDPSQVSTLPQPGFADQAMNAARGIGSAASGALSTVGQALTDSSNAAHASFAGRALDSAVDTGLDLSGAKDAWAGTDRQMAINKQAADQGFVVADNPRFQAANPDLAAEYDQINQSKMMGAMGQGDTKIAGALFGGAGKPIIGAAEQAVASSFGHATPGVNLGLKGLKYQLFDNLAPVQEMMNTVENQLGRKLGDSENAYQLLRLGRASNEIGDAWFTNHVGDALGSIQEVGGSVKNGTDALNNYLRAKDAIDKSALNPGRNFGGMNGAQAQTALGEMQARLGPQGFAALEDKANQFYKLGDFLLDRKVQAGLVSPELATQLKTQYPHYMPIQVIDWLDDNMSSTSSRVGRAGGGANDIKALTEAGTDRQAEEPLQAFYRAAQRTAMLSAKNEAGMALVKGAAQVPTLQGLIRPADNEAAKLLGQGTNAASSYVRSPGEQVLQLRQNGDLVKFYVDKSLEPLVNYGVTTGAGAWQPVVNVMSKAANVVRQGAIAYNPVWGVGQLGMDSLTYLVKEGGLFNKDVGKNVGYLWQGLKESATQGDLYKAARNAGGLPGTIEHATGEAGGYGKVIQGMTGRDVTTPQEFMGWAKDTLLSKVRGINEVFDAAPRLAEFAKQQDMGASASKAALAARDVTLDPSRGGQLIRTINAVVPFFNVAFQGSAYLPRMLANPETRNKAISGITTSVMMPAMAAEFYNLKDPRYADVPDFDKQRGLVVMNPWVPAGTGKIDPTSGKEKPNYFLIRTGPFTPFVILARSLYGAALAADHDPQLGKTAVGLTKSLSPIDLAPVVQAGLNGQSMGQAAGDTAMAALPAGVKPLVEDWANRDTFRGAPIVPAGLENLPTEQQFTSETSETAKFISQQMANASNGRFTFSPAAIDHLLRAWGGGGQSVLSAVDAGGSALDKGLARTTGIEAGFGTGGDTARIKNLQDELAKTGITDEKRANIQAEIDRENAVQADKAGALRNVPLIGGVASSYLREGGSQTIDDRSNAVDKSLVDLKRDTSARGKELDRLNASVPDVQDSIGGVKLTRQQAVQYRESALEYRQRLLDDLMKQDVYKKADDAKKSQLVSDALSRGAGWAANAVLPGRADVGQEFTTPQIGQDLDTASTHYMKALADADALDKLRSTSRFTNVAPSDYKQTSADIVRLQQYTQLLGKPQAELMLTHEVGAARLARAINAKESPEWSDKLHMFRLQHPDYELFIGSAPQTTTKRAVSPEVVQRLAGLR